MADDKVDGPRLVKAAYKGVVHDFKVYRLPDGREFVRLPSGKRATVVRRLDGSYVVNER
ncbi:MAG TPA: hypothetical protein VFN64_00770 [Burkholderiaceae bacterium]|nr:hypothetical protein [Burkholderiaceae bacterium]